MNWNSFLRKARNGTAVTDGSMGVFLQQYGLKGGDCPELWNMDRPDIVRGVHESYIQAGSDLIITNSLGGNRVKLADFGLAGRLRDINAAAVRIARQASRGRAIVAADVGPTGLFVEPVGNLAFDEMVDIYREQIAVLADAGADAVFFETHIDILELKAGILACREVCDLPIIASMTFEKDGRTVTGSPPEAAFVTLEALGADVVGTNCGTGPVDMLSVIRRAEGLLEIPLVAQANAGLPKVVDGRTVFDETPDRFAEAALQMAQCGVTVSGGCCGTTPEHIRHLRERVVSYRKKNPVSVARRDVLRLASRYLLREIGHGVPFCVIGERLNPTARKALAQDIRSGAFALFKDDAIAQEKAGADVLDLNMGIPDAAEPEAVLMKKGVGILSTAVNLPLAIDTTNPEAARAGMRVYPGKPLLNSISAEPDRLTLLDDVKKYGAAFIALPIDGRGVPKTAEERVRIMKRIVREAEKRGIDRRNILADPLVLTVSAEQDGARETLRTVRRFREELGLSTTMGLSNVSYGLPARAYVNRAFLAMAVESGLTSAIVNPMDADLMGLVRASDVLTGKDRNSKNFIEIYSSQVLSGKGSPAVSAPVVAGAVLSPERTVEQELRNAVLTGKKEIIAGLVRDALNQGRQAFALLNEHLIPAITEVGALYEKRTYFLPQLMLSAEAMTAAFTVLEPLLKRENARPAGRLVFATVQGDVHDIGKNIVILLLKNHGYQVTDLGKDVPADVIHQAAVRENADVVCLSALMTTTMPRMEEFVRYQKDRGDTRPVVVGGAAVTREYASSIGARYATDAVDAVKVVGEVLAGNR